MTEGGGERKEGRLGLGEGKCATFLNEGEIFAPRNGGGRHDGDRRRQPDATAAG